MSELTVTYLGGPTVILEYGGLRILSDPTFDAPGTYPDPDGGQTLVKTAGPALGPGEVGGIDLVLLSHHQHEDNLDDSGREFLAGAPLTLSTGKAAKELGGTVEALDPGQSRVVGAVTVTATRALHGPAELDPVLGPVIGFLLEAAGEATVYLSGDNASLDVVREVVDQAQGVDVAVLHAGAARVGEIDADLTLGSTDAAKAAVILAAKQVIGVHTEDWEHFSETREQLVAAFAAADLAEVLVDTPRGRGVVVSVVPY